VKIGTDADAERVEVSKPRSGTIGELLGLETPGPVALHTPRYELERRVYELKNVRLACFKHEGGTHGDRDYHLVLQDLAHEATVPEDDPKCARLNPKDFDISGLMTMIAEIPDPECLSENNPWQASIEQARSSFDAKYSPTTKPQRVDDIVSVRGVAFFDVLHGQLGVAENGIELHPIMSICFGRSCALP
jgi:hypothetical protein